MVVNSQGTRAPPVLKDTGRVSSESGPYLLISGPKQPGFVDPSGYTCNVCSLRHMEEGKSRKGRHCTVVLTDRRPMLL